MFWSLMYAPVAPHAPPFGRVNCGSMVTAWPIPLIWYVSTTAAPLPSLYTRCACPETVSETSAVWSVPKTLVHCFTDSVRLPDWTVKSDERLRHRPDRG